MVKTPPFHGGNTGSNPVGVIFFNKEHIILIWRRSQVVRPVSYTHLDVYKRQIKSIAVNDKYIAMVLENDTKSAQEKYQAVVYNKNGRSVMEHEFSSEYTKLLLGEKEIVLAGNYHFSVLNFAGHEMYQKDFKKRISNVSLTGKKRRYLITYEDNINLLELR